MVGVGIGVGSERLGGAEDLIVRVADVAGRGEDGVDVER